MKKGFTLIEIIAVIILLGVLSLIAIGNVDKTIKENKQKLMIFKLKILLQELKCGLVRMF